MNKKKLGELLVETGMTSAADVQAALVLQRAGSDGCRVGELLVRMGKLSPDSLARALAVQFDLPYTELPPVSAEVSRIIPPRFQVQHRLVPFRVDSAGPGPWLHLALADPANLAAVEVVRTQLRKPVAVYVAAADAIDAALAALAQGVGRAGPPVLAPAPPEPVATEDLLAQPPPPPAVLIAPIPSGSQPRVPVVKFGGAAARPPPPALPIDETPTPTTAVSALSMATATSPSPGTAKANGATTPPAGLAAKGWPKLEPTPVPGPAALEVTSAASELQGSNPRQDKPPLSLAASSDVDLSDTGEHPALGATLAQTAGDGLELCVEEVEPVQRPAPVFPVLAAQVPPSLRQRPPDTGKVPIARRVTPQEILAAADALEARLIPGVGGPSTPSPVARQGPGPGGHPTATSEAVTRITARQTPIPVKPTIEFSDADLQVLEAIEKIAGGAEPGDGSEKVKPARMVAALIRLLIKKNLINELEFLDELSRK